MNAVIGDKKDLVCGLCESCRARGAWSRKNILNLDGAHALAIALPQLETREAVGRCHHNRMRQCLDANGKRFQPPNGPGLMSFTKTVPATVPSLVHNSS